MFATRRIGIAATNRLGRRVRHDGITPGDQQELELLLADAFDGLQQVSDVLHRDLPKLPFTPRLKTLGTIVDKIGREETMALSRMRDLAGIRIVEEMNRVEQDVLVRQVAEALGVENCKVIDRRTNPSNGYRAVHIEVDCGTSFVEIQVRTALQDQWAQVVERLGDSWGRQIRYGGGPPEPTFEIVPNFTRADLWELIMDFSGSIDGTEVIEALVALEVGDEDDDRRIQVATERRELRNLLERVATVVVAGRI